MAWRLLWVEHDGCRTIWRCACWQWLQSIHWNLCAWRRNCDSVRHTKSRSSIQPKYGSLCTDPPDIQCVWELRQLGILKERSDHLYAAREHCVWIRIID